MNIHSIPHNYNEFERFNADYAHCHFWYTEANQRVGTATREVFAAWFPWLLRRLVQPVIHAILDDALIEFFDFPRPSRTLRPLVTRSLRLRGRLLRWLPTRQQPRFRAELLHRRYPGGYEIGRLGPHTGRQ